MACSMSHSKWVAKQHLEPGSLAPKRDSFLLSHTQPWPECIRRGTQAEEGKRRSRQQKMRCLGNITDSMDVNLSELREMVKDRGAWRAAVPGVAKSRTQLSN